MQRLQLFHQQGQSQDCSHLFLGQVDRLDHHFQVDPSSCAPGLCLQPIKTIKIYNISLGSSVLKVSERFKKVVTKVLFNILQDYKLSFLKSNFH
jgi:hypothetical protein